MKSIFIILVCSIFSCSSLLAQNLMTERIRKITPRKKSVYFSKGIFHNGGVKGPAILKAVRHSYTERTGYERIVFDFDSKEVPQIYGNISSKENKLYLDFFKSSLGKGIGSFGSSKFVKNIHFFNISKESLSVELIFKESINMDIFYLKAPGRLVVDIKN